MFIPSSYPLSDSYKVLSRPVDGPMLGYFQRIASALISLFKRIVGLPDAETYQDLEMAFGSLSKLYTDLQEDNLYLRNNLTGLNRDYNALKGRVTGASTDQVAENVRMWCLLPFKILFSPIYFPFVLTVEMISLPLRIIGWFIPLPPVHDFSSSVLLCP